MADGSVIVRNAVVTTTPKMIETGRTAAAGTNTILTTRETAVATVIARGVTGTGKGNMTMTGTGITATTAIAIATETAVTGTAKTKPRKNAKSAVVGAENVSAKEGTRATIAGLLDTSPKRAPTPSSYSRITGRMKVEG